MASKKFEALSKELTSACCPEDFFGNHEENDIEDRIDKRRKELKRALASRNSSKDKGGDNYELRLAKELTFRFDFLADWALQKVYALMPEEGLAYGDKAKYRAKISFKVVEFRGSKFLLFEKVPSETLGLRVYLSRLSAYMFFDFDNYARYWQLNRLKITKTDGAIVEVGIKTEGKFNSEVERVYFSFGSRNQYLEASEMGVGDTVEVYTVFHRSWHSFFFGVDEPFEYGTCLYQNASDGNYQMIVDHWGGNRLVE